VSQPPADWYPDPSNPNQWRYWSGTEWTDNVAPRDIPAEPVVAESQPVPVIEPASVPSLETVGFAANTTPAPEASGGRRRQAEATGVASEPLAQVQELLSSRRNQLIAAGAALAVVGIAAIAFMMHGSDVPESATAPALNGQPTSASPANPSVNDAAVSEVVVPVILNASKANGSAITITAPVPASPSSTTLVISAPYTTAKPLDLGTFTLNSAATDYTSTMPLNGLKIVDSRDPSSAYTVYALASDFKKAGVSNPGTNETISAQDIGLTSVHIVSSDASPRTFIGAQTSDAAVSNTNLVGYENQAGAHIMSSAKGNQGLGGSPHKVFHASTGKGTTTIGGILSVDAPTNTLDGVYVGTITFTIVGK
jgi:hypothetical protein